MSNAPKPRLKSLVTEDLNMTVTGCRAFGELLDVNSADTYGKLWKDENVSMSFAILAKIVERLNLDPDKTPLSALWDFGTGYKASKRIQTAPVDWPPASANEPKKKGGKAKT